MVGILLASLIWWDHPNLFNHLSFPYIRIPFPFRQFDASNDSREVSSPNKNFLNLDTKS
jgi:hypothetical protein